MNKHTKGPWHVIGKQGTAIWAGDKIIAQMSEARTNHKQARADAELIASAPDLLASLVEARAAVGYLAPERYDEPEHEAQFLALLARIDADIAKATGAAP